MVSSRSDVSRLAAVGGSGLESHSRRILKFLITNEIACSFNWKGRNKIAFENTRIMAIIYGNIEKKKEIKEISNC
ncbi:hypothetical protein NQ314_003052 [Rhamnusium bicolor]|uniref:DUF4806 domain-containing protein n=1 Tax=Rhamnusium bicolor TaxID=1586634 RepID=A0AAV8ZQ56_9CUCU|nr:hypothetical protein NQ314_003052 [Rhamnusium bicolor]